MNGAIHNRVMDRLNGLFDQSIMQNDLRGMYAEFLVAELLGKPWKAVGSAWAGWDIEHEDKTRLEVKQSAARQTWDPPANGRSSPQFGIKAPKGYWIGGANWVQSNSRPADIYVFAWHGELGDRADHRDPNQWAFFVVNEHDLPEGQKSIGLTALAKLASPVQHSNLRAKTESIRMKLKSGEHVV